MTHEELKRAVKAELLETGISFEKVNITHEEIIITQIGDHDSLSAICGILEAVGLFKYDNDTRTKDARTEKDTDPNGAVLLTVHYLKRQP